MNNTFNIKRFGLVLRKDLIENRQRYTFLFLTMFGIMAVTSITTSWNFYLLELDKRGFSHDYVNKELLKYIFSFFLAGGILFAPTFIAPMNSKLKRFSYLISPSSNFEKFFSRWLIVTIGYILSFFVALWIMDLLRVVILTARFPELDIQFLDLTKLYNPIKTDDVSIEYMMPKIAFTTVIFIYFLLQSLFILGATFWEKSPLIKTFTVLLIIAFAYLTLSRWTILLFYGDYYIFTHVLYKSIFIHILGQGFVTNVILSVFTLTNWILAYFRVRESEIIKRL